MSKEYPLYPELPKAGQEEAQKLIDSFKGKLKKAADEVLADLYCDIVLYIESDSWTNFRNQIMDGFKDYKNNKIQNAYDFKIIRQSMYNEFREEINKDLDQDNLEEIKKLKETIETLQEQRRNSY